MLRCCLFSNAKKSEHHHQDRDLNIYSTHLPPQLYDYLLRCGVIDLHDSQKTQTEGTCFSFGGKSGNAVAKITVENGSEKMGMLSIRVYLVDSPKHSPNRFNFSNGKWYRSEYYLSLEDAYVISKGRPNTNAIDIYEHDKADKRTEKEVKFLLKFLQKYHVTPDNAKINLYPRNLAQ